MNVNSGKFPVYEKMCPDEEPYNIDEGWWDSILAEEHGAKTTQHSTTFKTPAKAETNVNWELVEGYHSRDEIISLRVNGYNRGGLLVQGEGIQGFVPVSHLVHLSLECDPEGQNISLKKYVGKDLELKVIECDPSQERVVLSERAALAGEGCRKRLFQSLSAGEIVCGTVTNVTNFGVFVELGGVEGLIHVSELSWGRVNHPRDILSVGQKIETQVLYISEQDEKVALSYKRQFHNPWSDILDNYQPGMVTTATITSLTRYGAFARIEQGIEGLIHISTINLKQHPVPGVPADNVTLDDILQLGQEVDVRILHIDVERRRLGLELMDYEWH